VLGREGKAGNEGERERKTEKLDSWCLCGRKRGLPVFTGV